MATADGRGVRDSGVRLTDGGLAFASKTEARMATARMKLLRNRREAQVRQMRRDIAALLRDKQEDTARIRVSARHREFRFVLLHYKLVHRRNLGY